MRYLSIPFAAIFLLAGCSNGENRDLTNSPAKSHSAEDKTMVANKARNPQRAVEEEFAKAADINTVPAWELFIARHPDNALATEARKRLAQLR